MIRPRSSFPLPAPPVASAVIDRAVPTHTLRLPALLATSVPPGDLAMNRAISKIAGYVGGALALAALAQAGAMQPACAQPPQMVIEPGVMVKRLSMGIGRSVIVDLPRDAAEIFIGSPKVANAVVRSPRRLFIIALDNGQTSIFALDALGKQIAVIEVSNGRNIEELSSILQTAMPKSDISMRTVNDTIILTGTVDTPGEAQQALDIAKGFVGAANTSGTNTASSAADGKVINAISIRGRDQVTLKVTVAEIQRDITKSLGLTSGGAVGSWGKLTLDNPLTLNLQQASNTSLQLGNSASKLSGFIQAFERNGVGRILAEPNVTAVSGENAKFTAGGEIPVPGSQDCTRNSTTGTIVSCSIGVTFKPYGVTLNFTPVVLSEGRIQLRVASEVTEVDNEHQLTFTSANVPAFRTRKHETTVELPSGGSIASAGLITARSRQVVNGLPGLMNLPVLGTLFRSRDYLREETELLIIVTAYISKPVGPKDIVRPTDNFAEATDPQTLLLGRVNRLYSTTSNPQVIQNYKGKVGFIND